MADNNSFATLAGEDQKLVRVKVEAEVDPVDEAPETDTDYEEEGEDLPADGKDEGEDLPVDQEGYRDWKRHTGKIGWIERVKPRNHGGAHASASAGDADKFKYLAVIISDHKSKPRPIKARFDECWHKEGDNPVLTPGTKVEYSILRRKGNGHRGIPPAMFAVDVTAEDGDWLEGTYEPVTRTNGIVRHADADVFRGRVAKFDNKAGFGFVDTDFRDQRGTVFTSSIFMHQTEVLEDGYVPQVGDIVEYESEENPRALDKRGRPKLCAKRVLIVKKADE
jgi:cold shock CspA family protein